MTNAINETVQQIEHRKHILEEKLRAKEQMIKMLESEAGLYRCQIIALDNRLYGVLKQSNG